MHHFQFYRLCDSVQYQFCRIMSLTEIHCTTFDLKLLFLFLISFSSTAWCQNVRSEVTLSPEFILGWEITNDGETIMFDITATTTGWVGLGISETGSMANADIFVAGFDINNANILYYQDYFGASVNGEPTVDTTRDWFLNVASENATHTTLLFERKLNTEDSQDIEITDEEIFVIWALGSTDAFGYHGTKRGQTVLNFLNPGATESTTATSTTTTQTSQITRVTSPITESTEPEDASTYSEVASTFPDTTASYPSSTSSIDPAKTTRNSNSSSTIRSKLLTVFLYYWIKFAICNILHLNE